MTNDTILNELPHIWICADWHFCHDREFVWGVRGFESIEQMNNAIIQRHNSIVRPDEDVYVLGDLILGGANKLEEGLNLIKQMNGKLHIVRGNHDTNERWKAYMNLPNVVEQQNSLYLKYKKYYFYMSHYPSLTGNLEKEKLKQMTLNLYGHTHQKSHFYEDRPYMYCTCMDAHDCYPCNLNDIIIEMKDKMKECKEMATGITPHDACVKKDIPSAPYDIWKKNEEFRQNYCEKCVHYHIACGGPEFLRTKCPDNIKYRRDPPDGGYYG